MDRFELVRLGYQDREDELAIVSARVRRSPSSELMEGALDIVRGTRNDPRVRRGASVRAAVAIADLAVDLGLERAAELALPTRIELFDERAKQLTEVMASLKKASGVATS